MFKLLEKLEEESTGGEPAPTGAEEVKPNTETNVDPYATMWQPPKEEEPKEQAAVQVVQQAPQTYNIDAHIESLGLAPPVNTELFQSALQGDAEAMQNVLQANSNQIYKQMLGDVNKLITAKIAAAVDSAGAATGAQINDKLAMNALASEVPASRNPAIQPMVEAAFKQFLQTKSVSEAIAETKKYLAYVGTTIGDSQTANVGQQGELNDGSVTSGAKEEDWLELLKG